MIKTRQSDNDVDEFLDCIPYFIKDNVLFQREEYDGYISIHSRFVPRMQELFLNKTTQIILSKCNGEKKVSQIIEEFLSLFEGVSKKEVEKDVIDVLISLYKIQIITWKGKNPIMYSLVEEVNGRKFCSAEEGDIKKILKFIKENINKSDMLQYNHPLTIKEVYLDEVYLREMLFNFDEDYYFIEEKDEIKGLISLKFSKSQRSNISSVGILLCKDEDIEFMLKYTMEFAKEISQKEISKVKLQVIQESEVVTQSKLERVLNNLNFDFEGLFKKEVNFKDVKYYSYYVC